MQRIITVCVVVAALATPMTASAQTSARPVHHGHCRTHACWHRVHVHRLELMVGKRIAAITPYRCGPVRSVVPCYIINRESSMCGYWYALNGPCPGGRPVADSRTPCDRRACGIYQLLGSEKHAPWPVVVTWGRRLWRRYETLKRELAHHRIARGLAMSAWNASA